MRKFLFTLAPAAALLMSVTGTTQAADNAMVTFSGNVQANTCDVRANTTALDLGTFKPSAFPTTTKTAVPGSTKGFSLVLENCEAAAAAGTASLKVVGNTADGTSDVFAGDSTSSYGVILNKVGETDLVENNDEIALKAFPTAPGADELDGLKLEMQASLAKVGTTVNTGNMRAPVVFQFIYN